MRNNPESLMLFAAGRGTRMGALTQHTPKPLIQVAGRVLIDHAIDLAIGANIQNIVVNTHYKSEMIEQHLIDTSIQTIHEIELLETGGGLKNALSILGQGPVFTLNSDAVWKGENPIQILSEAWNPNVMDCLSLVIPVSRAQGHTSGDFSIDPAGKISRDGDFVYTGAQIIKTDLLFDIDQESFSLNVLWNKMIINQRMFGMEYGGSWCDVGRPENINIAEDMLRS